MFWRILPEIILKVEENRCHSKCKVWYFLMQKTGQLLRLIDLWLIALNNQDNMLRNYSQSAILTRTSANFTTSFLFELSFQSLLSSSISQSAESSESHIACPTCVNTAKQWDEFWYLYSCCFLNLKCFSMLGETIAKKLDSANEGRILFVRWRFSCRKVNGVFPKKKVNILPLYKILRIQIWYWIWNLELFIH